ncbi:MAG: proline--tRNA ligase [Bacteroidetes bacterium]|nr:proline--tRNA ligase [Bacteroidota bacterium]
MSKEITPRSKDYAQWYNDLVLKGGLADYSAVRGCMVIKPYGFALWENMRDRMDRMFKDTGHVNAYFPLFVPRTFLEKEEGHAEGFAKECAVVTHYRLKVDPANKGNLMVDPDSKLEEELIIRPTSETVIWNAYRDWIRSYRDLPLLINQWANVVRWEMRTRLFLRTTEFLWQEGHTAHATADEAVEETRRMLDVYADFVENWMALPVVKGAKTANERFAGAVDTYCIEALMQDGKALQAGTSHFLGQNFSKAFDVKFLTRENQLEYVWATSWGTSTRLIGALVMAHSDDKGLVLPPRIAPLQVVIVPIHKGDEQKALIDERVHLLMAELKTLGISVKYDDTDNARPGWKFAEHELKGVPVRIAIGVRDLQNNVAEVARRDIGSKESVSLEGLALHIHLLLEEIQQNLLQRARTYRDAHITRVDTWDAFKEVLETQGGFLSAHWDGTPETEERIKEETKATIRCIPLDNPPEEGTCIYSGKPSRERVLFAIAY